MRKILGYWSTLIVHVFFTFSFKLTIFYSFPASINPDVLLKTNSELWVFRILPLSWIILSEFTTASQHYTILSAHCPPEWDWNVFEERKEIRKIFCIWCGPVVNRRLECVACVLVHAYKLGLTQQADWLVPLPPINSVYTEGGCNALGTDLINLVFTGNSHLHTYFKKKVRQNDKLYFSMPNFLHLLNERHYFPWILCWVFLLHTKQKHSSAFFMMCQPSCISDSSYGFLLRDFSRFSNMVHQTAISWWPNLSTGLSS